MSSKLHMTVCTAFRRKAKIPHVLVFCTFDPNPLLGWDSSPLSLQRLLIVKAASQVIFFSSLALMSPAVLMHSYFRFVYAR